MYTLLYYITVCTEYYCMCTYIMYYITVCTEYYCTCITVCVCTHVAKVCVCTHTSTVLYSLNWSNLYIQYHVW